MWFPSALMVVGTVPPNVTKEGKYWSKKLAKNVSRIIRMASQFFKQLRVCFLASKLGRIKKKSRPDTKFGQKCQLRISK